MNINQIIKKFKKPITLTYTDEMKLNDKLWEIEQEDRKLMAQLYEQIITEARNKGFKCTYIIYDGNEEKIVEIFKNEEEQELCQLGILNSYNLFGYCKPLIQYIEQCLNKED